MLQSVPTIELFDEPSRLTKKQKRLLRKQGQQITPNHGLRIKQVYPITANQRKTFEAYDSKNNLCLTGCAGTGKTFLSMYLSLEEILEGNSPYKKLIIFRSVVPSRDIGFLPGKAADKAAIYESPYQNVCAELFGRADAYEVLKHKKLIQFETTSFVRGLTLTDCVVIVDECQNMTAMELNSLITRVGENCKIIFSGDIFQTDLNKRKELSGLSDFMKIFQAMDEFTFIEFQPEDIVRSKLVKSYILTKMKLERQGEIQPLI